MRLSKGVLLKYAVVGALSGYFLLHPAVMILTELMHLHEREGFFHLHGLAESLAAASRAFSLQMWPWSLALAGLTAGMGTLYGFWVNHLERKIRRQAWELRDSEHRFESLVRSAKDAIVSTDHNMSIRSWNGGARTVFGYGTKEVLGKPVQILMGEGYKNALQTRHRTREGEIEEGGNTFEALCLRRDGTEFPAEVSAARWKVRSGECSGFIIRDVSLRKQVESELVTSKERLSLLLSSSPAVIYSNTSDGLVTTFISQSVTSLTGYAPQDFLDDSDFWTEHIHPDDRGDVLSNLPKVHNKGWLSHEYRLLHKDGSYLWVRDGFKLVKDESGVAMEIIGYWTDITEQKNVEQRLRESEKRYRTIVESSSDCICSLDLDGNFLYMSPAGLHAHAAMSPDDIRSKHWSELARREYASLIEEKIEEARQGGTVRFQYQSETDNGVRWLESTLAPMRDSQGRVANFISVSRDVTDQKTKERQAEHVNKRLESRVKKRTAELDRANKALDRSNRKLMQTLEQIEGKLQETVSALSCVVKARDQYTASHQQKVAELARGIAKKLGLSEEEREGIFVAGMVHDVGKINVPSEILTKPTKLSDMEISLIKEHPQIGHDILDSIEFPWPVGEAVLQHHERLDGSGYPKGLSGAAICLNARILAVADVVEAMSSHRPYRPAIGIEQALKEISDNKGILYDSKVVDACLELNAGGKRRAKAAKVAKTAKGATKPKGATRAKAAAKAKSTDRKSKPRPPAKQAKKRAKTTKIADSQEGAD